MKKNIQFAVEGFADYTLLKMFSIPDKYISISGGSSGVAGTMRNQLNNFHKIIIGVVDIDKKNNPTYFDEFTLIDDPDDILYKRKNESNQYLVSLCCNGIENWINTAANSVGISSSMFNLPNDIKEITKHEQIQNNKEYYNFLSAIKEKEANSFVCLQKVLEDHIPNEWKQN